MVQWVCQKKRRVTLFILRLTLVCGCGYCAVCALLLWGSCPHTPLEISRLFTLRASFCVVADAGFCERLVRLRRQLLYAHAYSSRTFFLWCEYSISAPSMALLFAPSMGRATAALRNLNVSTRTILGALCVPSVARASRFSALSTFLRRSRAKRGDVNYCISTAVRCKHGACIKEKHPVS